MNVGMNAKACEKKGEGESVIDSVLEAESETKKNESERKSENCREKKSTDDRGRTRERQSTLDASLQFRSPTHHRSATPKRHLSGDGASSASASKQPKVSSDLSGRRSPPASNSDSSSRPG